MDEKANRFLTAFNKIEKHLEAKLGNKGKMPFFRMIEEIKSKSAIIRRYEIELKEFGNLRNAIVHSYSDSKVIAIPIEETVNKIEDIEMKISKPRKVGDLFSCEVVSTGLENYLSDVLPVMKNSFISQIPVVDQGEVVEVLNTNTIARWLADQEIVAPEETKIKDLLSWIEFEKSFRFVKSGTDIYMAAEKFRYKDDERFFIDALFITQDGTNNDDLKGIISLSDLSKEKVL